MPLPNVPNVASVRIDATLDGQQYNNVFHYNFGTLPVLADLEDLAELVAVTYRDEIIPFHVNEFILYGATVTDLSDAARNQAEYLLATGPQVGGQTGNALPNNVALSIAKISGSTPRVKRGRIAMSGFPASYLAAGGNAWVAASIDAVVTGWETFVTEVNASSTVPGNLAILSGYADPVPVSGVRVGIWETVAIRDYIVDSSRRRLPGRGA